MGVSFAEDSGIYGGADRDTDGGADGDTDELEEESSATGAGTPAEKYFAMYLYTVVPVGTYTAIMSSVKMT